jgi:hypothetical protein
MPSKRRVFVVQWSESLDYAMYCDSDPTDQISRWLQLFAGVVNTQASSDEDKTEVLVPGDDCLLYDWSLDELPPGIRVNQVPKPGVVFAVRKGAKLPVEAAEAGAKTTDADGNDADPDPSDSEYMLVYLLKRQMAHDDDTYSKRLQRFLASPEAEYEPLPVTRFDAFVSYSTDDQALTSQIVADIEARGMRTFMASRDLAAGNVWAEEIRQALLASGALLIVLTPNSWSRPWVMCEVGASWALGKPLLPALAYVDPKTLPEVITAYQARRIETAQGRRALVDELARLCGVAEKLAAVE